MTYFECGKAMDGALGIVQSVLSTSNDYVHIYLNELDEHQNYENQESDRLVQFISSTLSKYQKCHEGLVALNCYLKQASLNVLEQKASLWTSLTLKALNSKGSEANYELAYSALSMLVSKTVRSPEISKAFASNHVAKIYESLAKVSPVGYLAALKCTEVCLRMYPGPSGPSRSSVEKFLTKFIDTRDEGLALWSGKCTHLLQQVRGGGVQGMSHKTAWMSYQEKLIGSLHHVLDFAFSNCNELYDWPQAKKDDYGFPLLELDDEPTKRAAQLFIRFRNLLNYLATALREPFPVAKPVMPKKIINLIFRGLSVTCPTLEKNPISDNLALGLLLPKMHLLLLNLLEALILTLRSNLKPHHLTILGLLVDTLNWTASRFSGLKKPLSNLRCKTYEVLALWCTTLQSGSRIELFGETLVDNVLLDILPHQNECILQVLHGSKKHMSKKARRVLHKAQNEQTHLSQTHSNDNSLRKDHFSDEENQQLCASALKCLQEMLLSAANFLKPSLIKMLQLKIVQTCGVFYEIPLERQHLFYSWVCRAEIYKVMRILITHPHHLCPPPTHMILEVLKTARFRDSNPNVRKQCAEGLTFLENISHPRKEGLLFPADIRDIRNHFVRVGKESLLTCGIFDAGIQNDSPENNFRNDGEIPLKPDSSVNAVQAVSNPSEITKSNGNTSDIQVENANFEKSPELNSRVNKNDVEAQIPSDIDEENVDSLSEPVSKKQRHDDHDNKEPVMLENKIKINSERCNSNKECILEINGPNDKRIIEVNDNINDDIGVEHRNQPIHNEHIAVTDDDIFAEIQATFVDELN